MKTFFAGYIFLLVSVFVLWSIEPLHRAQEASSVTIGAPVALASSSIATSTPQALVKAKQLQNTAVVEAIEQGVIKKINEERTAGGLPALTENDTLAMLARSHSADMLENNYFGHSDAMGCSSSCRISDAGYHWSMSGENIYTMNGYSISVDKAVDMATESWMESAEHRANILNPSFSEVGVGIAIEGSKLYATADFALPQ